MYVHTYQSNYENELYSFIHPDRINVKIANYIENNENIK